MTDSEPQARASRYVVVKFGDLHRGETMNIGILAWDHPIPFNEPPPPETPVMQRIIEEAEWARIFEAFPRGYNAELREDVVNRLQAIKTYGDYMHVWNRMGPYSPFEFTEERPSVGGAGDLLEAMWKYFFVDRPR